MQSSNSTAEPLQTVFPVGDDMRLAEALEIAAEDKQVRIHIYRTFPLFYMISFCL